MFSRRKITSQILAAPSNSSDVQEIALQHAWNWFEYHAGQRISIMQFSITVLGGVAAGIGVLHQQKEQTLAVLGAFLGALLSYCFAKFDRRVSKLVKLGEQALCSEQNKLALSTGCNEFRICAIADMTAKGKVTSYGQILRLIYSSTGLVFLLFAVLETGLPTRLIVLLCRWLTPPV